MYSKNYLEIKSAITDGLHDFCKKNQSNQKEEPKSIIEIIKEFSFIIPIVSLLFTCITKFISMGHVWHFQFDFNYYDFSLSSLDLFLFIFSLLSSIIGFIIACTTSYLLTLIKKFLHKTVKPIMQLLTTYLVGITFVVIVSLLVYFVFKATIMALFFGMLSFATMCLTFALIPVNINSTKTKKMFIISSLVLATMIIFTISSYLFQTSYESAKTKRDFKIVNMDNVNYAVVSESDGVFSAYQCNIDESILTIYTNCQRTINNSDSKYEVYLFEKVQYETYIKIFDKDKNEYLFVSS